MGLAGCGAVVIIFLVGLYLMTADGISIECYPNATIKMENPQPNYFTNGVANDSAQICGVTFSSNKSHIFIDSCNMDETILLSLTNRTANDVVMGGYGSQLYLLRCDGVGDGVNKTVAHTFLPSVPYTSESPRTMLSYAESVFREGNTSGQELTAASVGSRIVWSMECAGT